MQSLSRALSALLIAATFGLWLFLRGLPEFTGFPRILFNLVVAVAAIWWMWVIWSNSAWNPGPAELRGEPLPEDQSQNGRDEL